MSFIEVCFKLEDALRSSLSPTNSAWNSTGLFLEFDILLDCAQNMTNTSVSWFCLISPCSVHIHSWEFVVVCGYGVHHHPFVGIHHCPWGLLPKWEIVILCECGELSARLVHGLDRRYCSQQVMLITWDRDELDSKQRCDDLESLVWEKLRSCEPRMMLG